MVYFILDDYLKTINMSRYMLSKETGIDNNTLGKICNNKSKQIKLETIDKICSCLNCNISDIIKYEDDFNCEIDDNKINFKGIIYDYVAEEKSSYSCCKPKDKKPKKYKIKIRTKNE